jgi:hypothetical protein
VGGVQSVDVFKIDDLYKRLFGYLQTVNPVLVSEFFEQRKAAESMFDQALEQL